MLEKSNKGHVVATCRNPSKATGLLDLKNKFAERLDIHQLDLTIDSTIEVSICRGLIMFFVANSVITCIMCSLYHMWLCRKRQIL